MLYADAPSPTKTWLSCPRPQAQVRARLLCLPHAGGSPTAFRPWAADMPPDVEMLVLRLPGREARLRETPLTHVDEVVGPLAEALSPLLDVPLVVFGHSLGAMLGFELCRSMRRAGLPAPKRLVVSGRNAPGVGRSLTLHTLSDQELVAEVQRIYGGIPQAILDEPELLALTLPVLRADLAVNETHELSDEAPLECGIEAYGGLDDPHVSLAGLEGWGAHTSASFAAERCEGDHFYLAPPVGRRWIQAKLASLV